MIQDFLIKKSRTRENKFTINRNFFGFYAIFFIISGLIIALGSNNLYADQNSAELSLSEISAYKDFGVSEPVTEDDYLNDISYIEEDVSAISLTTESVLKLGHLHEITVVVNSNETVDVQDVPISFVFSKEPAEEQTEPDETITFFGGTYKIPAVTPGENEYKIRMIVPPAYNHSGAYNLIAMVHNMYLMASVEGLDGGDEFIPPSNEVIIDPIDIGNPDLLPWEISLTNDVYILFEDENLAKENTQLIEGHASIISMANSVNDVKVGFKIKSEDGNVNNDIMALNGKEYLFIDKLTIPAMEKFVGEGFDFSLQLTPIAISAIKSYMASKTQNVSAFSIVIELNSADESNPFKNNNTLEIPVTIVMDYSSDSPTGSTIPSKSGTGTNYTEFTIKDHSASFQIGKKGYRVKASIEDGFYSYMAGRSEFITKTFVKFPCEIGSHDFDLLDLYAVVRYDYFDPLGSEAFKSNEHPTDLDLDHISDCKTGLLAGIEVLNQFVIDKKLDFDDTWSTSDAITNTLFTDYGKGPYYTKGNSGFTNVFEKSGPISTSKDIDYEQTIYVYGIPLTFKLGIYVTAGFHACIEIKQDIKASAFPYFISGVYAEGLVGYTYCGAGLRGDLRLLNHYLLASAWTTVTGDQNNGTNLTLNYNAELAYISKGPYGTLSAVAYWKWPCIKWKEKCKWGACVKYPKPGWCNDKKSWELYRWDSDIMTSYLLLRKYGTVNININNPVPDAAPLTDDLGNPISIIVNGQPCDLRPCSPNSCLDYLYGAGHCTQSCY